MRPLSSSQQIYAALDAHCLLGLFTSLISKKECQKILIENVSLSYLSSYHSEEQEKQEEKEIEDQINQQQFQNKQENNENNENNDEEDNQITLLMNQSWKKYVVVNI